MFIINFVGVFCADNADAAVFTFAEYDYRETPKNVCDS